MTSSASGPASTLATSGRPPRLVLATGNAGKVRELAGLLGDAAAIIPMTTLGMSLPPETGSTFEANARAKARFVATKTGMLTLADDSGLEVLALNGAPGVYSARYAGPHATDAENRALLLARMRSIPESGRAARFVCVLAIADHAGAVRIFSGSCVGSIAHREVGAGGFGYDPIFQLQDGRTMAELSPDLKNEISHRSIALRSALPILLASLPSGTLQQERYPEPGGSDDNLDLGARIG